MAISEPRDRLRETAWRFGRDHKNQRIRMSSTERLPFTQWADIYRTERFISIQPKSGYRRALPENEGYVIYLPPDASDDVLGGSLVEALNRSRFIWPADEPEFFEWSRFTQCSRDWQNDFMKRYGYKTKRDAYKNMDWSRAERSEGNISIKPHKRDKPEYLRDLPPDRTVIISAADNAARIGAALRLALDRCE
jgi:hypothetical protein